MKRYTKNGKLLKEYTIEEALLRLTVYEDFEENAEKQVENIEGKMNDLRKEGKEKSLAFRQNFSDKMQIITILKKLRQGKE